MSDTDELLAQVTVAAKRRKTPSPAAAGTVFRDLERDLQEFGLTGNEAMVLLGVLRLGSATAAQLARVAPIATANIYKLVTALEAKGLVERVPGTEPATWLSLGRDETLDRLCLAHEEQVRQLRSRAARVKEALLQAVPDAPSMPLPFVHVVHGALESARTYESLMDKTRGEVLMFTVPPFSTPVGHHHEAVLGALGRGVSIRVLYPAAMMDDPEAETYRAGLDDCYHPAGVQGRVADELPMKMALFDQKIALIGMVDPALPTAFPTVLLVDHPGFAGLQAAAFEELWRSAQPYPEGASAVGASTSTEGPTQRAGSGR